MLVGINPATIPSDKLRFYNPRAGIKNVARRIKIYGHEIPIGEEKPCIAIRRAANGTGKIKQRTKDRVVEGGGSQEPGIRLSPIPGFSRKWKTQSFSRPPASFKLCRS